MIKIKHACHEHIGFIFHNMQEKELKSNKRLPLSYRTKLSLNLYMMINWAMNFLTIEGNLKAHNLQLLS